MRITKLEMDNFGPFNGHRVDGFSSGLNVVHGDNEAGKSALRALIRVILFGFPRARTTERTEYFYQPSLPGGASGTLFITDANGDPYSISRVEGAHGGPVTISGTRDGGDDLLNELIGGVDNAFYQNVFSISLTQLQSFEALGRAEITERIYSAGLGMSNVSLRDVTKRLDERLSRFQRTASARSTAGSLFDLQRNLDEVREKLEEHRRKLSGYDRFSDKLRELEATSSQLDEQIKCVRTDSAHTERLLKLHNPWLNRQRLQREVSELPSLSAIPVDGVKRLEELTSDISNLKSLIDKNDRIHRERKRRIAGLSVIDAFPERESDIHTATSSIAYYQEAVRDIPKRTAEAEQIESEVDRELAAIGPNWTSERIADFKDAAGTIARIQSTADFRDEAHRAASSAREDVETALVAVELTTESLRVAENRLLAAPSPPTESMEELERKRDRVATLEAALAELDTTRSHGTESSASDSRTRISLPGISLIIAGLFGVVLGMILGEIAGAATGLLVIFAGTGLLITSHRQSKPRTYQADERPDAANEVASITEQLDLPRSVSIRAVVEIRNAIGREIDRKRESSVLIEAEQAARIAFNTDQKRHVKASEKVDEMTLQLRKADESWAQLLTLLELHSHFNRVEATAAISGLGVLAVRNKEAFELRQRVSAMQTQNAETDRLLAAIFRDAGLNAPIAGAGLPALHELEQRWDKHVKALVQQQTLKRESEDWVDERSTLFKQLELANTEVSNLLCAAGCDTADQFRELDDRINVRRRKERDLDALKATAPDLFGAQASKIDLSLDNVEPEALQADLITFEEKIQKLEEDRKSTIREEGEIVEALRQMETGEEVADLYARMDELTERIRDEARQWSVLTVARSLLNQTREEFQEQRQPSLLKAASNYFNEMTLGKYTGVRAVIGEERFEAINAEGESVPPEHLSRGTAEQLWLSIRFALVDEYGPRARLPVVLDDLLVNFDPQRARAACSAITSLAERQQVIFLTCQPTTVAMLEEAIAERKGVNISVTRLSSTQQDDESRISDGLTKSTEPSRSPSETITPTAEAPAPRMQPLL